MAGAATGPGSPTPRSDAELWALLTGIPDPEIPVLSITDLGIVRGAALDGDHARVEITPTYSGCPATSAITLAIDMTLRGAGLEPDLRIRLDPPWTTDWMTDTGREKLRRYGIAPPSPAGGPNACPRCGSGDVTRISQFGSTPCKAQWRCDGCFEPFDYFKCI
ncbi:1,2-phenylacetyl-CoA epoxidase subunit PaaD [Jannaschia sp. KMU-145]|uniref:1,2-phenylacetyl-CoA epoxidase subunit PaaD n=1 Tax=Jannaschia halovivens TaxID=3388667 RepID=UPI00396B37B5